METNKITSLNFLTYSRLLNNIDQLSKNISTTPIKQIIQQQTSNYNLANYLIK